MKQRGWVVITDHRKLVKRADLQMRNTIGILLQDDAANYML